MTASATVARDWQISIETLIGCSRLLGHQLESRQSIREGTDEPFLRQIESHSAVPIGGDVGRGFLLAPLDVLVQRTDAGNRFHVIELNGSGIGGLTSMSPEPVAGVLDQLRQTAEQFEETTPLVLIGLSGRENDAAPRLNRLAHEKVMYAEAVRRGLLRRHAAVDVTTANPTDHCREVIERGNAAVVVGYLREFLEETECVDGQLRLAGRPVTCVINDRLVLNLKMKFGPECCFDEITAINRCYAVGADKGMVYQHLQDFGAGGPVDACLATDVRFEVCQGHDEIERVIVDRMAKNRPAVLKPSGTGLGHGIEFFLDPDEPIDAIRHKINRSLEDTQRLYHLAAPAYPYTICDYIDTAVIDDAASDFVGHKFEIRVVVYQAGERLVAHPLIAKIAPEKFDADDTGKQMLINNITNSIVTTQRNGFEFMLPLCNEDTLQTLGIRRDELIRLSGECTRFVHHVLKNTPA